jgi:hypothetical protein
LERGGKVEQLAEYFGHHDVRVTRAYLGVDKDEVNAIAMLIDFTTNTEPVPEKKPDNKSKPRIIQQGAFITNVAQPKLPAVTLPSPAPENAVGVKDGGEMGVSNRPVYGVLDDWRKLPTNERVYLLNMMIAEVGTQLVDLKRKAND